MAEKGGDEIVKSAEVEKSRDKRRNLK